MSTQKTTIDWMRFRTQGDPGQVLQAVAPLFGEFAQYAHLGAHERGMFGFQTGLPIPGNDLVTQFIAGGIPPSPVGGVVIVDGKQVPFVIGGPGPTPISPQKITPKIRADRKPIYRVQRID